MERSSSALSGLAICLLAALLPSPAQAQSSALVLATKEVTPECESPVTTYFTTSLGKQIEASRLEVSPATVLWTQRAFFSDGSPIFESEASLTIGALPASFPARGAARFEVTGKFVVRTATQGSAGSLTYEIVADGADLVGASGPIRLDAKQSDDTRTFTLTAKESEVALKLRLRNSPCEIVWAWRAAAGPAVAASPPPEAAPPLALGAPLADPRAEMNRLIVDARKAFDRAAGLAGEQKNVALRDALDRLREAVDQYPTTDHAVTLIGGGEVAGISIPMIEKMLAGAPGVAPTILIAQKAVLYEEPIDSAGAAKVARRINAAVTWDLVTAGSEGPAIVALLDVPDRGLKIKFSIRKNSNQTISASHLIEVLATVPANFPGKGIQNVPRLVLKPAEDARGQPLIGTPAKIADGFFRIALSAVDSDVKNNLALLRDRGWIDLPLVYETGQRAILTFEKGASGDRAFGEALAAWGDSVAQRAAVPQAQQTQVVSSAPSLQEAATIRSTHSAWQVRCDTPAGAQHCVLAQFVAVEGRENIGLWVTILKTADKRSRIMRVLAPLGVMLPSGLGLKIEESDLGRVGFLRCLPNGCVAEVTLEDKILDQLKTGKTATFIVFQTAGESISIPISLNGFRAGFDALLILPN